MYLRTTSRESGKASAGSLRARAGAQHPSLRERRENDKASRWLPACEGRRETPIASYGCSHVMGTDAPQRTSWVTVMHRCRVNSDVCWWACQAHQALVMVENVRAPSSSGVVSGALQSRNVQLLPNSWQSFCRRCRTACQNVFPPRFWSQLCLQDTNGALPGPPLNILLTIRTCERQEKRGMGDIHNKRSRMS